jgi:uncharacterized protein with FMN-binding domain
VRRIVIWLASTVTVVVLLFGYHTSTNASATAGSSSSTSAPAAPTATTPAASGPPRPSSTPSPSSSSSSGSSGSSSGTKTYTGDVTRTRWGPVEVKITVASGTVTKVDVLQSPSGNGRDREINDRALPVLVQETLDAQNAKIDMVSGATVTSDGYVGSLQSALDQAGI